MGCIYMARNKVNGKCYVGKTVRTLAVRRDEHIDYAIKGSYSAFYNALRKYGPDTFEWSVLDECDNPKVLNALERMFIRRLGTKAPNGYNLTDGGDGFQRGNKYNLGRKHSPKSRWNMGFPKRGRKFTEEHKHKLSEAQKGRVFSEEHKRKMSESGKLKRLSEEHKQKISEALKGRVFSDEHRAKISKALRKRNYGSEI